MGTSDSTWPTTEVFENVLGRARQAEPQALSILYRRFLPVVYRYALINVCDPHYAEDITADTFFAMVEGIANLRATDELGYAAWLLGIARNKVLMHFRRLRNRLEDPKGLDVTSGTQLYAVGDEDDPLNIITARESWETVSAALGRLTEEQRAVVLYRCVLGFSTDDLATMLGKRPKAIRALQSRALASLARHLGIEKKVRRNASEDTPQVEEQNHALR